MLPVVPICEPGVYTGEETTYCTFNMDEMPTAHANNHPRAIRYLIQLHLFMPGGAKPPSPRATKWALCRAILGAGFTYPRVENASDAETQHLVLEFEGVDGEV